MGIVNLTSVVDYFELVPGCGCQGMSTSAADCRAACGSNSECTGYAWLGPKDKRCMVRNDDAWMPFTSEGAVSGRRWYGGSDNPSPVVDAVTGETRVLFRSH